MRIGWILGVTLVLGACGGEADLLPSQVRVQTNFQADPFPGDTAASERAGAYTAISSSGDHTCAIRKDGSLWCWGSNGDGQVGAGVLSTVVEAPTRVGGEVGWERVSAGGDHTCGIRLGSLYCWGRNWDGQVGDGSQNSRVAPVQLARGGWRDVAAANDKSCAINAAGKLYCWGYDDNGTITGHARTPEQYSVTTPLLVEPTGVFRQVVLSPGPRLACALEEAGSIWCWGAQVPPVEAPFNPSRRLGEETDWVRLSLEQSALCASKADGSRWCWSEVERAFVRTPKEWKSEALISEAHFCGVALDGSLWCSGQDDFGQLGNGVPREEALQVTQIGTGTGWIAVATGRAHSCAINQAGELWCWGGDNLAQLGVGRARTQIGPQLVGLGWDSVWLGRTHSCGTQAGQILCWGSPQPLPMLPPPSGLPAKIGLLGEQIVSDGYRISTLTQGKLSTWATANAMRTWDVGLFRQISASSFSTCGIAEDGALYCAQDPYNGTPERLGTDVWMSVAVGGPHACGITQANKLYCWGRGRYLGVLPPADHAAPQAVTPERDYVQVASGSSSSCAIAADQSLWCWGFGYYGALGTGSFWEELLPVRTGTELWSQVSVGSHACAIRADGALFCWGPNGSGQLGIPAGQGTGSPLQVGSSVDWKHVVAGESHTCALNQASQLYCWGSDSDGQIGVREPWLAEPTRVWPL